MAVDASLASLYEKLKVDDPFLPPRPWESIPSESGLSHSRCRASSSGQRLFDISTVSVSPIYLHGGRGFQAPVCMFVLLV